MRARNQIRGLLAEFGLIVPQGIRHLYQRVPLLLEEAKDELPGLFQELVQRLLSHLKVLDRQVDEMELQIQMWHRSNPLSRKLEKIPGIGPLTASALIASVGNAKSFYNGWQLAAWLGLVPKQHSTGGKPTLLRISKRGDCYLRTLLIHGARAVIYALERKSPTARWLTNLLGLWCELWIRDELTWAPSYELSQPGRHCQVAGIRHCFLKWGLWCKLPLG